MPFLQQFSDNISALQIFQATRQLAYLLVSIIIARSYLGLEDIGQYETLMYLSMIISFFWTNGCIQALLAYYPNLDLKLSRGLITNVFFIFQALAIGIVIVLFVFQAQILPWLTGSDELKALDVFLIYLLFHLPAFLIEYILLLNDRARTIIYYGIISFLALLACIAIPLFLGQDYRTLISSLCLWAICKYAYLIILLLKYCQVDFTNSTLLPFVKRAYPLVLYALLAGLAIYFDQWLVSWAFDDKGSFAIFRYGARELPLATALAGALSLALIPMIAKNQALGLTKLKQRSKQLMHYLFPISILLMITSPWWYPIVFRAEFIQSVPIFIFYLLILISRLIFPQTILLALNASKTLLWVSLTELALNIILSVIWLEYFGLMGIAMATFVAFLFEKLLLMIVLSKHWNISPLRYIPVWTWLVYSILLGLVAAITFQFL